MKKQLALLMVLMMVFALALTSCTTQQEQPPAEQGSQATATESEALGEDEVSAEPVEIRFLAIANDTRREIYDEVFAMIEEQTNITVMPEYVTNWDEFNQKFMTQLGAQDPPDIIDVAILYRDQFIDDDYLYDIAPILDEHGFDFTQHYESQFSGLRRGDELYGMPNGTTMMGLYYNKDLFDAAGLDYPTSDWQNGMSYDEFYNLVETLTVGEGANKQYGFACTFDLSYLFPLFWQNGADFVSADGTTSTINTPEGIATLEYIDNLMFENEYSPSLSTLNTMGPRDLFLTGKIAMYMDGNWSMNAMSEIDTFEWGVAVLPKVDEPVTGVYIDSWSVTAGSKNPDAAVTVLEYLVSEEALALGSAKGIPSLISFAETQIDTLYDYVDEDSRMAWSSAIEVGRTPVYTNNWAQVIAEANKSLEKLALNEFTAQEAAAEIERTTNELISE